MAFLLHHTLLETVRAAPKNALLIQHDHPPITAAEFARQVLVLAGQLLRLGLLADDRVAVFLPKVPLCAYAYYGVSYAGGVFVPINPVLKSAQVRHILNDCSARILITNSERLRHLGSIIDDCPHLEHVLLETAPAAAPAIRRSWSAWSDTAGMDSGRSSVAPASRIDNDMAAILYTSGSTGPPKGVVISHRNLVEGARSVAQYLGMDAQDRILAVLPFSFDYGLNQLTTAVLTGATCVLFDHLLPKDVVTALELHKVTGLAGVPPLWAQLAPLQWPEQVRRSLRYFTNSGGTMPESVLARLRDQLPRTQPYLMYGLTEAFRSTYLPPAEIDVRRGSIGRAIPNADILVVRADGTPASVNEPGELVHRGALVSLGYWNDVERTALRFRPAPARAAALPLAEIAVWSGDTVRMDEAGYVYFIGRADDMIKTSGYRVSPDEIEEVAYGLRDVEAAVAIGVAHAELGQAIVLIVRLAAASTLGASDIVAACRSVLPNYLVPALVIVRADIPQNANGKIDRRQLQSEYAEVFSARTS